MTSLGVCIWFDSEAEEAAQLYTSVLPDSRILKTTTYPTETPSEKPIGSVLTVELEVLGQRLTLLNGGPGHPHGDAMSLMVPCDSQEESDRLWEAMLEAGAEGVACGWLTDPFGVAWQIFPAELDELTGDPDPERARRATEEMLKQVRIDLEPIRAAADGA